MSDRLKDKTCIITGGGAGLGEATAFLFAEQGAQVVVMDQCAEDAKRVTDQIQSDGGSAVAVIADVAKEPDVERTVSAALELGGSIDVLVNNAAVGGAGYNYTVTDLPDEVWYRCMEVNMRGPTLCMKHVIPVMKQQAKGSIVNVGSISSVVGLPTQGIYAATKGAILQLTRQVAIDFTRYGIRVNCILPGGMDTPMMRRELSDPESQETAEKEKAMMPMPRYAEPREVAYAIVFLASDEASYITGASLAVDGGFTAQ